MKLRSVVRALTTLVALSLFAVASIAETGGYDYRVLATKKTSTLEKEINEAADAGYRFHSVMGGQTALGGSEGVVVMYKRNGEESDSHRLYKLLATSKTSTMQKEMQELGDEGFEYRGQTVFASTFGGQEVVVILELDKDNPGKRVEYKLLATKKTSTMQEELRESGEAGYQLMDVTVSKTAFGGTELVCILRRDGQ